MRSHRFAWGLLLIVACGPSTTPPAADSSGSASTASSDGTTPMTSDEPTSAETLTGLADSSTGDPTTTVDPSDSTSSDSGIPPFEPPTCAGVVYDCVNGRDDDGDGLVDFEDPDCTSPCDDAEDSLRTNLPDEFNDCNVDCAFDTNGGMGDDGCSYRIDCDPLNSGEFIACEYDPAPFCDDTPFVDRDCIAVCEPRVPPGCDCFGCCEVQIDGAPLTFYIHGHPDCSFDDLASCVPCTPHIDACGNPCDSAGCEQCIGELGPPPGCADNVCDVGDPCESHGDCEAGGYCAWGCCFPPQI